MRSNAQVLARGGTVERRVVGSAGWRGRRCFAVATSLRETEREKEFVWEERERPFARLNLESL